MFHVHKWEEIGRSYTSPPPIKSFKQGDASEHFAKTVFFGVTTVELRCKCCGDIKSKELIGDAR